MDCAEQIDIGELTIDAAFLARRFAISPDALRRHMKLGLVRSLVERGEGEDAGRTRLTVRIGNRTWRGDRFRRRCGERAHGACTRPSCCRIQAILTASANAFTRSLFREGWRF
ncbi:DUF6522 family protein [Rhizobium sp. SRDI969]|uniref:DUF6522 family protein n=1 Tax=Rhizobium sp. SRDI969 TaxID=3138252 RepID=UPI0021A25E97|nr:DUF6522 family protein [Rhizobium leguminosarum]UWM85215.1 DUF6522 family protein [Rhizobium leguminosarum bv. viciae]